MVAGRSLVEGKEARAQFTVKPNGRLDQIETEQYPVERAPAVQETREQMEQPVHQPSGGVPSEGIL